jgi:hypothetical protein
VFTEIVCACVFIELITCTCIRFYVRFLMVELTYSGSNSRFDIDVAFMTNYFSVGVDISVDSEALLVTDFANLKIKPTQYF